MGKSEIEWLKEVEQQTGEDLSALSAIATMGDFLEYVESTGMEGVTPTHISAIGVLISSAAESIYKRDCELCEEIADRVHKLKTKAAAKPNPPA